ncbi:MAG: hypothetical protein ACYC63_04855 [Armatimonadota bacterium]
MASRRSVVGPNQKSLRDAGWETIQVAGGCDGVWHILGYSDGTWRMTRRSDDDRVLRYANNRREKQIGRGVVGDADLDVDGQCVVVIIPVGLDSDGLLEDYRECTSEDGGDTWMKQAG